MGAAAVAVDGQDGRWVFKATRAPDIPGKTSDAPSDPCAAPAAPAASDAPCRGSQPRPASAAGAGKDKELEEKKARLRPQKPRQKNAEDEKIARPKPKTAPATCAKAAFDASQAHHPSQYPGRKIFTDAHAAEAKRIDEIVASDCVR